jgi:hypothetical protein
MMWQHLQRKVDRYQQIPRSNPLTFNDVER